jgi:hypothetical protein
VHAILDAIEESASHPGAGVGVAVTRLEIVVLDEDAFAAAAAAFREFLPRTERRREESRLAEEFLRQLERGGK